MLVGSLEEMKNGALNNARVREVSQRCSPRDNGYFAGQLLLRKAMSGATSPRLQHRLLILFWKCNMTLYT